MIKSIGTLLILLTSIIGYSQSKIVGKVLDEEFNETMPFANVLVKGSSMGLQLILMEIIQLLSLQLDTL